MFSLKIGLGIIIGLIGTAFIVTACSVSLLSGAAHSISSPSSTVAPQPTHSSSAWIGQEKSECDALTGEWSNPGPSYSGDSPNSVANHGLCTVRYTVDKVTNSYPVYFDANGQITGDGIDTAANCSSEDDSYFTAVWHADSDICANNSDATVTSGSDGQESDG